MVGVNVIVGVSVMVGVSVGGIRVATSTSGHMGVGDSNMVGVS